MKIAVDDPIEEAESLLGQATLRVWGDLPREAQELLFGSAVADAEHLRKPLATFLHDRHPKTVRPPEPAIPAEVVEREEIIVFWRPSEPLQTMKGAKIPVREERAFESLLKAAHFIMEDLNESDRTTAIILAGRRSIQIADIAKMYSAEKKSAAQQCARPNET